MCKDIVLSDDTVYRWNPVWNTYNSVRGNMILTIEKAKNIDWEKTKQQNQEK